MIETRDHRVPLRFAQNRERGKPQGIRAIAAGTHVGVRRSHHVSPPARLPEMSAHQHARDGAIFGKPKQCDAMRRVRSRLDAGFAAVHGDHRTHLLEVRRCVHAISGMVHSGSALRAL